jgi:hypothetical protein
MLAAADDRLEPGVGVASVVDPHSFRRQSSGGKNRVPSGGKSPGSAKSSPQDRISGVGVATPPDTPPDIAAANEGAADKHFGDLPHPSVASQTPTPAESGPNSLAGALPVVDQLGSREVHDDSSKQGLSLTSPTPTVSGPPLGFQPGLGSSEGLEVAHDLALSGLDGAEAANAAHEEGAAADWVDRSAPERGIAMEGVSGVFLGGGVALKEPVQPAPPRSLPDRALGRGRGRGRGRSRGGKLREPTER